MSSTRYQTQNGDRAFLRWVGGKRFVANKILSLLPADAQERLYFEPFAGAASLFFTLAPKRAVLSDLNQHLIECYRFIRKDCKKVASCLARLVRAHSADHYYRVRETYNHSSFSAAQAARFIYLN